MTRATKLGLLAAFVAAVSAVVGGSLSTNTISARVRCIPFPSGWVDDGGTVTVHVDQALFPRVALDTLNFARLSDAGPDWTEGDFFVTGYPDSSAGAAALAALADSALPGMIRPDDDDSIHVLSSSPLPACQVAVRVDGANGASFPCACAPRTGTACVAQLSVPDGGLAWIPGPPAQTFSAGTWATDGGCVRKACRETLGQPATSMPVSCQ